MPPQTSWLPGVRMRVKPLANLKRSRMLSVMVAGRTEHSHGKAALRMDDARVPLEYPAPRLPQYLAWPCMLQRCSRTTPCTHLEEHAGRA